MEKFLILVMLTGGAHAFIPVSDSKCNAIQSPMCSVTLGASVYIQVMNNASGFQLRCKKELPGESINVFSLKKEKVTIDGAFRNRTEFFMNNSTVKIRNVERSDSGQYMVEVYDSNGVRRKDIQVQLDVKEDIFPILIPVCAAAGGLVLLVICCCVCRRVRHRKKPDSVI